VCHPEFSEPAGVSRRLDLPVLVESSSWNWMAFVGFLLMFLVVVMAVKRRVVEISPGGS